MKRLAGLFLLTAAGCSGFDAPFPRRLEGLPLKPDETASRPRLGPVYTRCRFQMSLDSPWLAGEFEGAVLAEWRPLGSRLRVQLFGDLGPKMVDLSVRSDRVVGFFPQTREGIDCALPGEETRHFLLFLGAALFEEFGMETTPSRVEGIRDEGDGAWLRLRPALPGVETHLFVDRTHREVKRRRFWWMLGIRWEEEWTDEVTCSIRAPNLSIRVKILERKREKPADLGVLDLTLPPDVKVVAGSRK